MRIISIASSSREAVEEAACIAVALRENGVDAHAHIRDDGKSTTVEVPNPPRDKR